MKYCYRLALAGALATSLLGLRAAAQPTPPAAGRLHYEGMRRVDRDKVKITSITMNGQPMRPEDMETTLQLPHSVSSEKNLVFSGSYAKEERDLKALGGSLLLGTAKTGQPGAPTPLPKGVLLPFLETKYLNLADRTATTVTTLTSTNTAYATPAQPVPAPPAGWQDLPQTKKIAGYLCHKVTVPYKQETYTLWVTTELPFAYSPVRELTPAQGVVLALSSDQEEYTATGLAAEPVAEADVRPSPQARPVTEAELKELRAKANADQRQRVLEQMAGGSR
jgi:GLPGLI family protein